MKTENVKKIEIKNYQKRIYIKNLYNDILNSFEIVFLLKVNRNASFPAFPSAYQILYLNNID